MLRTPPPPDRRPLFCACGRLAIATCDTAVRNDVLAFEVCGRGMCCEHLGSEPQPGFHRCVDHARLRGDPPFRSPLLRRVQPVHP